MPELKVQRLVRFEGEGSLRAFCDIAVAEIFLINGLRVVEGKNGLVVSMPRQQGKDGKYYDNVVALNKDVKKETDRVVLQAYQQ